MPAPIDALLDTVEWIPLPPGNNGPVDDGLPYATHSGVLTIGEYDFKVHRLSDGRAVIDSDDFLRFFGDALCH